MCIDVQGLSLHDVLRMLLPWQNAISYVLFVNPSAVKIIFINASMWSVLPRGRCIYTTYTYKRSETLACQQWLAKVSGKVYQQVRLTLMLACNGLHRRGRFMGYELTALDHNDKLNRAMCSCGR